MEPSGRRPERRDGHQRPRTGRRNPSPGRRKYDDMTHTTLSRRTIVASVAFVDFLYLVGDILVNGSLNSCL